MTVISLSVITLSVIITLSVVTVLSAQIDYICA